MNSRRQLLFTALCFLLGTGLMAQATSFQVDLAAITNVNVTLDANCEATVLPSMVLSGDFDDDHDGETPPDDAFGIVVEDDDPTNGATIDGCGRFRWVATNSPFLITPDPITDFTVLSPVTFAGPNASVSVGADEIVLTSVGADPTMEAPGMTGATPTDDDVSVTFNITENGQLTFNYAYALEAIILSDVFRIEINGAELLNVEPSDQGTGGIPVTGSGVFQFPVAAGDDIVVSLIGDDFNTEQQSSTATLSGLIFQPDDVPGTLTGFTTAWGYLNAEDKTSPVIETLPEAPGDLLCDEVDDVSINTLAQDISRCWVQSGDNATTLDMSMASALRTKLLAGGGIPDFRDGCSDVTICVTDVVNTDGPCGDVSITRTFVARDGDCPSVSGEENEPTVESYVINFYRPDFSELVRPRDFPGEARFSCEDFSADDPNPVPEAEDYPFFEVFGERIYLDENFCNYVATYSDGPRIETECDETYKFVRTYTVANWCPNEETGSLEYETYTQLVKVGDFEGPEINAPSQDLDFDGEADDYPLKFTTNSLDCGSFFVIPAGDAEDNCDPNPTVSVVVYAFGDRNSLPIGPFAVGSLAGPFPLTVGDQEHLLVYTAVDACGNESDELEVPFIVVDETAPVAKCEDALNVSIGGSGIAVIDAEDINKNSYDECSDVTLAIACVNDENENITPYAPSLTVTCDDLGPKLIGLRVTDAAGNVNFCWLEILIEDKVGPICIPPPARTVTCVDLAGDFPEDLNALFEADPDGTAALLDAQFGSANGVDNCGVEDDRQTVDDQRNNCGKGKIVRTFTVVDGEGFESAPNSCVQVITVNLVHDYIIEFPADAGSEECIEPGYNGVTFDELGCDLLTTNVKIDTFTATADECYKLRVTYEIFNWCEYDSSFDPYVIPRDEDGYSADGFFLHVLPLDDDDLSDDLAILDEDDDRTNNTGANSTLIDQLDRQDGGLVNGSSDDDGYGTDGSRGAFLYRQFIKVYDDEAPVLTVVEPDGPGLDNDGDCDGNIDLEFSITEECSPGSVSVTASLNAFVEDANDDGVISLAEFVAGSDVTANVVALGDGSYEINLTDLPLGRHAVRIRVTDGCGNTAVDLIVFDIEDNKAPTPICINGLTVTLMPDGQGGGMAEIWASDFVASPSEDCAGEVKFAIYRAVDAAVPGFEPDTDDVGLTLTCDDDATTVIRIYAIDPNGQSDYCETTLLVQQHQEGLCGGGGAGSLSGSIMTAAAGVVPGVSVSISGDASAQTTTDNSGYYAFTELEIGDDYTVAAEFDSYQYHINGVSTFDLVLISKHILGIDELASSYELLAADANGDQNVSVQDIIAIRRLILGLDNAYRSSPAWRFVDASYDFPVNGNPWATTFPEVFNVNNLPGNVLDGNFIAIMVGNVDGNGLNNLNAGAEPRSGGHFGLSVANRDLVAGNNYNVDVTAAEAARLEGFQGTLELAEGLKLVSIEAGALTAANFNTAYAERGWVNFSYVADERLTADQVLFTLVVNAQTDAQLSELLSVGDELTRAEAYTLEGGLQQLGVDFTGAEDQSGFELLQNTPNPVADATTIGFHLPSTAQVELLVRDVSGKVVLRRNLEGVTGYNTTVVTRDELKASGLLTYTLTSDNFTATKKMVVAH